MRLAFETRVSAILLTDVSVYTSNRDSRRVVQKQKAAAEATAPEFKRNPVWN